MKIVCVLGERVVVAGASSKGDGSERAGGAAGRAQVALAKDRSKVGGDADGARCRALAPRGGTRPLKLQGRQTAFAVRGQPVRRGEGRRRGTAGRGAAATGLGFGHQGKSPVATLTACRRSQSR